MPARPSPRLAAARLVGAVLDNGASLTEAVVPGKRMDARDAAFARHLAYGVLRWLSALDWLASQLMERPFKRSNQDVQRLLLVGLFELWKNESGHHAAVNETAECARKLGKPWAVGVINAVLRRFQRERGTWLERLDSTDARFAHPEWLVERLRGDWPEDWPAILEANNEPAGLWLRVNQARADLRSVADAMAGAGFTTRGHPYAPNALEVSPPAPVEGLPGFKEGLWSVQDPAAQLAIGWLDPQPGQSVLDACAAPGGKAFHVLASVADVRVLALDRSAPRLERLRQDAERLGLSSTERLQVRSGDATHPEDWWDGVPFDRILLDAPCTATGVIRRHPEIKWLRTPAQVEEAMNLQARLLRTLWPLLKTGGILVYATCSVLRDENSEQITRFIDDHGDARPEGREVDYGRPGEAGMDGFFYVRIRKNP